MESDPIDDEDIAAANAWGISSTEVAKRVASATFFYGTINYLLKIGGGFKN